MTTQSVRSGESGLLSTTRRQRTVLAWLAACTAFAAMVVGGPVGRARAATVRPSVAVPAYFWADDQWGRLLSGSTEVSYVILNPESGPGSMSYATFETKVATARSQGVTVLGYVDTGYGSRSTASVQADITKYRTWYGVNAFFFDQTPTACSELPYYEALSAFVRSQPNGVVFHNPGTNPGECFLSAADVVVNFEGSEASYAGWTPSAYTSSYPANRFWHIVYSVDPSHAAALLGSAADRQGGLVYLTEQGLPNPYSLIPNAVLWSAQTPSVTTRPPAPQAGSGTTTPGRPSAPQSGGPTTTAPARAEPVWAVGATVAPPSSTTLASAALVALDLDVAPVTTGPISSGEATTTTTTTATTTTMSTMPVVGVDPSEALADAAVPSVPVVLAEAAGPSAPAFLSAEPVAPPTTPALRTGRRTVATLRARRHGPRPETVSLV